MILATAPLEAGDVLPARAINIVGQNGSPICGKLRATIRIPRELPKDEAIAVAKADEKIAAMLQGKQILKEIYVPGKIVNIVAK